MGADFELSLALLHYPVYNKERRIVTTAVTNLDLHDLSRLAATYGCRRFYAVTPLPLQQKLVERLMGHWRDGRGAAFNPTRREAFALMRLTADLGQARADLEQLSGRPARVIATSARRVAGAWSYEQARRTLRSEGGSWLLVFGTGWGLTDEFLSTVPAAVLEPIAGPGEYNHLSVRTAAAVILDRLLVPER